MRGEKYIDTCASGNNSSNNAKGKRDVRLFAEFIIIVRGFKAGRISVGRCRGLLSHLILVRGFNVGF